MSTRRLRANVFSSQPRVYRGTAFRCGSYPSPVGRGNWPPARRASSREHRCTPTVPRVGATDEPHAEALHRSSGETVGDLLQVGEVLRSQVAFAELELRCLVDRVETELAGSQNLGTWRPARPRAVAVALGMPAEPAKVSKGHAACVAIASPCSNPFWWRSTDREPPKRRSKFQLTWQALSPRPSRR